MSMSIPRRPQVQQRMNRNNRNPYFSLQHAFGLGSQQWLDPLEFLQPSAPISANLESNDQEFDSRGWPMRKRSDITARAESPKPAVPSDSGFGSAHPIYRPYFKALPNFDDHVRRLTSYSDEYADSEIQMVADCTSSSPSPSTCYAEGFPLKKDTKTIKSNAEGSIQDIQDEEVFEIAPDTESENNAEVASESQRQSVASALENNRKRKHEAEAQSESQEEVKQVELEPEVCEAAEQPKKPKGNKWNLPNAHQVIAASLAVIAGSQMAMTYAFFRNSE